MKYGYACVSTDEQMPAMQLAGAYRNFKRYFATVPSGMHPLGWGGHRTPPPPRARRLAGRPATRKPAAGWWALSGLLAWGDGQQTPASRSEPLWSMLGETMGP
jgi:hypothetical protein